jgi:hypothetical protein
VISGSIKRGVIKGTDIENGTRYVQILNCAPILPVSSVTIQDFSVIWIDFIYSKFIIPPLPEGEGVYCFTSVRLPVLPSFRPSKIFFVAFFSVTVDGRNLIFGLKHHIGIPYCG